MSSATDFLNFNNPAFLGLLQGLGQAAMPSRMPVPFGAVLGMGMQGLQQGQQLGLSNQLTQQQIDSGKLSQKTTLWGLKQTLEQSNIARRRLGLPELSIDDILKGDSGTKMKSVSSFGTSSDGQLSPPETPQADLSSITPQPPSPAAIAMAPVTTDPAHSVPPPPMPPLDPKAFYKKFVLPHEGGYNPSDLNGSPVNMGFNQAANPDINVRSLTPEAAAERFDAKYYGPSGAAQLPPALAAVHADTYFINPAKATQLLHQSGGDPQTYLQMRQAWFDRLAATNPAAKKYLKAWTTRTQDLGQYAASLQGQTAAPTEGAMQAPPPPAPPQAQAPPPVDTRLQLALQLMAAGSPEGSKMLEELMKTHDLSGGQAMYGLNMDTAQAQQLAYNPQSFDLGPGQHHFEKGRETAAIAPNPIQSAPGSELIDPVSHQVIHTTPDRPEYRATTPGQTLLRINPDGSTTPIAGGAGMNSLPGDSNLTGAAYLQSLPAGQQNMVKAMAEGRTPYPGTLGLRNPQVIALMQATQQYDPTFDASTWNARNKLRSSFTSGVQGQNLLSINTAIGHLGSLDAAIDDLHNTGIPLLNKALIAWKKNAGSPEEQAAVQNYEVAKATVSTEIPKALRGAGLAEADIKHWLKIFDTAGSPTQLRSAVKQAVDLLDSRLDPLRAQWQNAMGPQSDPLIDIYPHAAQILEQLKSGTAPAAQATPAPKSTMTPKIAKPAGITQTATDARGKKIGWNGSAWVPLN